MKKSKPIIVYASVLYLFLLIMDALIGLFSLGKAVSGSTITLLGVSINNQVTDTNIATTFGLTTQVASSYLLFVVFCYGVYFIVKKVKK